MKNWLGKTDNFEELYFKRKPPKSKSWEPDTWSYIKIATEKNDGQWWYQLVYANDREVKVNDSKLICGENANTDILYLFFSENTYEITEEEYLIGIIK
tara:strand:- start:3275 stop:3568 length:294 start_codon:yes stop_codon:yes gene_type:complete